MTDVTKEAASLEAELRSRGVDQTVIEFIIARCYPPPKRKAGRPRNPPPSERQERLRGLAVRLYLYYSNDKKMFTKDRSNEAFRFVANLPGVTDSKLRRWLRADVPRSVRDGWRAYHKDEKNDEIA